MKRLALIVTLCGSALLPAAVAAPPPNPGEELMKQAQAAATAAKWDDALALYEKVIEEHPETSNRWYDAQTGIAQALAKKGDLAGAAKAAHLCLDSAPGAQAFDAAVMLMAGILSAEDKSVDRANQFIAFEQAGGKTNPMDAIGYPSQPDREKAFVTIRQNAGEDAAASRVRAFTYLLSGDPKDALAQFAEAFRRCDNNSDFQRVVTDLVGIGLRDMRGHRVGLDQDVQFVIYGSAGPDGKPGTSDDLTDPFASLLPAPPAPGEGGLSGLDAAGLATLRQVRDAAQLYGGDPLLFTEIRRPALLALQRSTSALDGWGAPGLKDWYLDHALGRGGIPQPDPSTRGMMLFGAELAARAPAYNLGAVDALWSEIDAACAANKIPIDKGFDSTRLQFTNLRTALARIQFPKQTYRTLTSPASF